MGVPKFYPTSKNLPIRSFANTTNQESGNAKSFPHVHLLFNNFLEVAFG